MAVTSDAFACSDEGRKYDSGTNSVFVVHAEVSHFERIVSPDRFCFEAKYRVKEIFLGKYAGPVDISMCGPIKDYHPPDDDEIEGERTWMGFEEGAEVIVGFTTDPPLGNTDLFPQPNGHLRYFSPSCWGALVLRIDKLGDEERSKTIEEWRTIVTNPNWVRQ